MAIPRNLSNLAQGADTSGVLGTSKGGTGLTTVGTNGQVLQSNGTSLVFATPATTSPAGSTGQIQYNNAGAFGAVSDGTSGQVLTSAGAGSAPTWSTPSSGAMVLISTQNFANQINPTFTSGISSTYKIYKLIAQFYSPESTNVASDLRFYAGGTADSSSGAYNSRYLDTSGTFTSSSGGSRVVVTNGNYGSSIINSWNIDVTIYAQYSQTNPFLAKVSWQGSAGSLAFINGAGQYIGAYGSVVSAITGIQIFTFNSIVTGTMSLYGISS